MDYAAALRASPAGPAVRLDTTPAAKAPTQKAPVSKPVKVEVEEPVHVAEEETVLSVSVPSAPAKPPTNAGLSPVVRFVITVPSSASASKESHAPAAESNAESSDSSSETEEDASGEVAANGSKSNKNEAKVHNFSAQDLDNNFAHLSDLVALLEKNAEERTFELAGGFRFSKGAKNGGKGGSSALHDLELPTVTLSLKWLSALIELLRSKTSTTIAAGGGAFVSIARVEGQIRVIRLSNGAAGKEVWLQFEDVVLEVREQAKMYLQVANRIEQVLERRESQLADKLRKDAAQRRRAISNKLHTAAFTSMLDTLHGLLAGSAEFPALSKRFHDQEAHLAQQRRRVKEENQDMMTIFFSFVPANLLEANLKHIAAQLEPAVEATEASETSGEAASSSAAPQTTEKKDKKLSKKEQAAAAVAAAAAEAERKKAAEAEAEVARKDAEKSRREKQEKIALLQAEQRKKQLVANPFAHLEGFSESAAAQLESEAELAKEKQISKAAEAKAKQTQKAVADKERQDAEAKVAAAARSAKTSAAAQDSLKRQVVEDTKRAATKEAEDKKRALAKEAEDKKKAAADRAAAEKAAADKRKQEKADKVAAEKAAAVARKQQSASPVASPSAEAPAKKDKVSGPDRSEKQRKAEKIEHQQKEKQRAKEMRQLGLAKKSDNTMLYAAIGGGAVIMLLVALFIYQKLSSGTLSN
jgi:hypothetical protein